MIVGKILTRQKITLISILFFVLCPLFVSGCLASKNTVIHILGVNDFHGQLTRMSMDHGKPVGTAAYLATHLKKRKGLDPTHTLLVHAGDMVGASGVVSALLQDEPTIQVMNTIGFDVGIPGNHEFDEGPNEMMRLLRGGIHPKTGPKPFEGANFPYIAANVIDKETKKPLLPPSIIKEIDGVKIAFIGVVTTDTPLTSSPGSVESLTFIDEVEAIQHEVENVKKQGANTIVVIAHEGGLTHASSPTLSGRIVTIANSLPPEVSVIIAGHTHEFNNHLVNGKLIVQSKYYGVAFEDITLVIDSTTGKVLSKKAEIVPTYHENMSPSADVEKIVTTAKKKLSPIIDQEAAYCVGGVPIDQNEAGESPLGQFIADAQRLRMKSDFALVNPFGVRSAIPIGIVTVGDLYEVQPHANKLIKMQLTGEQIRQLLNQQFTNSYRPQIVQPSGFTFSYDLSRPKNDQVIDIRAQDGKPIQDRHIYTMTINHFLANGGDGFTVCQEGIVLEEGPADVDALIEFMKELPKPFSFEAGGRIKKIQS